MQDNGIQSRRPFKKSRVWLSARGVKTPLGNLLRRMGEYLENAELEKKLLVRKGKTIHREQMLYYADRVERLKRRLTKIYLKEQAKIESALEGLRS